MDKIQIYSRSRSDTLQSDQNFLFRKLTHMKEMKEMTPHIVRNERNEPPHPKK